MKLRLLMILASAVLFLAPRPVSALESDGQQNAGALGRAVMQQNANESAQSTTDIPLGETGPSQSLQNVSYGGMPAGQSESGEPYTAPCTSGPQCRTYFGR